ncbi:uncharacterized protein LOC135294964 [Passer domesticus]|uniref:uncharacterized protein LOC135294964 n=1 Tax=Passer domesticus TaxID=48849 RepID=UPI0030FF39A1
MGNRLSVAEQEFFSYFNYKLEIQDIQFDKKQLKKLVKWVLKEFPNSDMSQKLDPDFWDSVGLKLYNTEKNKKSNLKLRPIFRTVLKFVIMENEKQAKTRERAECRQDREDRRKRSSEGTQKPSFIPAEKPRWRGREAARPAAPPPASPTPSRDRGEQTSPGQACLQNPSSKNPTRAKSSISPLKTLLWRSKSVNFDSKTGKSRADRIQSENNRARGNRHYSPEPSSVLRGRGSPSSSDSQESLGGCSLSSCPSEQGRTPFVGGARSVSLPLLPAHSPGQHTPSLPSVGTGSDAPELTLSKMAAPMSDNLPEQKTNYSYAPQCNFKQSKEEFNTQGVTDTWQRIRKDAVQEGEWEIASKLKVFPVKYTAGPGPRETWQQINFAELKEICKASRLYGRDSAYFRSLLQATFTANIFTPHDLKQLCTSLLSPTEFSLWELAWKRLLNDLLRGYAGTPATANLTIDQLSGEGAHTDPQIQARTLSRQVLQDVKEAAKTALLQVPDGNKPELDFTEIKQGIDEPYIKFLDRLKMALEKQIPIDRARQELLKRLAISNANPTCKKALRTLPQDPEPTLTQLVDACNRLSTPEHAAAMQAEVLASAITTAQENTLKQQEKAVERQTQTLAEALIAFKGAIENQQIPRDSCHSCGQRGHFKRGCPRTRRRPLPRNSGCRGFCHNTNSLYPAQGFSCHLPGNVQSSTEQWRATIQKPLHQRPETTTGHQVQNCNTSLQDFRPQCPQSHRTTQLSSLGPGTSAAGGLSSPVS